MKNKNDSYRCSQFPFLLKVILKMDQFGNGLEVDQARLGMCKQLGDVFTEEKFRYMCILSGCDYLSSLRGIGLAKACKLLRLANNPDILKVRVIYQLLCSVSKQFLNNRWISQNMDLKYSIISITNIVSLKGEMIKTLQLCFWQQMNPVFSSWQKISSSFLKMKTNIKKLQDKIL